MFISILSFLLVLGLDQVTKFIIFGTQTRSIIGDFLWFKSEENTGAAFSMFSGNNPLFIVITSVLCVVLIYLLFSKKFMTKKLEKISIAIICAGAISNLLDRIIYSYVRDFIYLKFINFAVFNIADSAITIGAILLIISILFFQNKDTKEWLN